MAHHRHPDPALAPRRSQPPALRHDPAPAVEWMLANWPLATGTGRPRRALHVGCGSGRNAAHLASLGVAVVGFDLALPALALSRRRPVPAAGRPFPALFCHDLTAGLPFVSGSFDLAIDRFVYDELPDRETRSRYRRELRRVLAAGGRWLLCVTSRDDGYYRRLVEAAPAGPRPSVVFDPVRGHPRVLFDPASLGGELAGDFSLEMQWHQRKPGQVGDERLERSYLVGSWRPCDG